jgi:WD40 repeat protein
MGHSSVIVGVAFSPDSRQVLTCASQDLVRLWDTASRREIRTFPGAVCAAFSPDGHQILTGVAQTAQLWDVASGKQIRGFEKHPGYVLSVAFSPDGKQVLTACYDRARLWDVATGEELRTFRGPGEPTLGNTVSCAAFSPDGRQVLVGGADKTARLCDVSNGKEILVFRGHTNAVASIAFSPDGKQVATGHTKYVASVTFSPDSMQLLTGCRDGTARLWSVKTGRVVRVITSNHNTTQHSESGVEDSVLATAFSPDGKHIFTGHGDGTALLWDAASGREMGSYTGRIESLIFVRFLPDGKRVLARGASQVWVFDFSTGTTNCIDCDRRQSTMSISPDGRYLLTRDVDSEYRTAKIWDVESNAVVRTFRGHTGEIRYGDFSPDGKLVFTGSRDGLVKLWNVATGGEIRTFQGNTVLRLTEEANTRFRGVVANDPLVRQTAASANRLIGNLKRAREIEDQAVLP